MKKFYALFALVCLSIITHAQVTVNGGPSLTYTSLNSAFAAINAGTHFGAITIDITGNTVEGAVGYLPTPLLASGQSAANYTSIDIRPTVQATIAGSPATGRGVIELDGADNVTIDGDIVSGPVQRDLTIQHTGLPSLAATAVVRFIGRTTGGLGATFNTVKNCILIGNTEGNNGISGSTVVNSYGIYAGATVVNLTTGGLGDNYDDNEFSNNEIQKAYFGIWIGGTAANPADNNLVSQNIIGSNTIGQTVTFGGVHVSSAVTTTISQNEIFNLKTNTSVNNAGIRVAGSSNSVTISRNNINGIYSSSTSGYGAYGIDLIGGSNHLIVNNAIYDILTVNYSSTSTTWNPFGIRITTGTGHRIYYNSINLFGDLTGASFANAGSAALVITATGVTGLDIRNNIFNNIQTSSPAAVTTKKFMAVWFPASYNFVNAILDNNAYNITNDADHFVGKIGITNNVNEAADLNAWKVFSQVNNASNDANSTPLFNSAAPFVSNFNLNIPANTNYGGESGAVLIPALGTNIDINGNIRPLAGINPNINPDMGAYEFDGVNGTPDDAGISALVNPASSGCYGSAEAVVVTIKNYGSNSISSIPVTVIVSGPINQTLTGTYAGPIAASAVYNYTLPGTVNMSTSGVYTFKSFTSLSGDTQLLNDTLANQTRTVTPAASLPQFVNFTGFTGANLPNVFPDWFEAAGAIVPTGTTSLWLSQTGLNATGNITARINLFTTTRNEWIVGPKILATANTNLSFDAAVTDWNSIVNPDVMGSDDKVRVMISTNCGLSYTPIFTIDASNNLGTIFTNFTIPLGAYAGQEIIVAFLAQDGPIDDIEDYDFHLDNINLYNASATDAGVSAVSSPSTGCFSSNEQVIVTVENFGSAAISNFPVTAFISGPINQTLSLTYTANLAVSSTGNFTLGTINMSAAGSYTIKSFTSLLGDTNGFNDTTTVVKITQPLALVPQTVSFTGFNSSNLPTIATGWYEAKGLTVPTGTIANWVLQNNFPTTGNANARIYLSGVAQQEWIVGPKILATASTNISFDAAVTGNIVSPFTPATMGSDDMLRLMISTDCGVSFTPIYTIGVSNNLPNTFSNFNVNLAAYNGQEIIVAFLATDGPVNDALFYYLHLDNINLYNGSATDAGVSAIIAPSSGCFGSNEDVVVTVENFGTAAISNFPVTAVISGAINQTLSLTYTASLAPSATDNFTLGTINMTTPGNYNIKAFTSLLGDPHAFNDTNSVIKNSVQLYALPQFVDFTGFTGANLHLMFAGWGEAVGASVPTGSTSLWTSQTGLNATGNITARINMFTTSRNEWIMGPKVLATTGTFLNFDAAVTDWTSITAPDVMGSDDRVRVMVSTDCGASYTPIFTLSAANNLGVSFTNFSVPLGAYAGQEVIIGFLAQDGPIDDLEDYDFHLDNINIFNAAAQDGGVSAIVTPTPDACMSINEQIEVTLTNYGFNSISNFPVTITINGPVNTTLNATYTGTIAPSSTVNFVVGTANMNVPGTYTIHGITAVSGDPNTFNDASTVIRIQNPSFAITGNNIICSSGSTTLNIVGAATSYTWDNSSNNASIVVNPSVTTTYSAQGTGTNNCVVSAFFTVTVNNPTISAVGFATCGINPTGTLTANAFAPVSWYNSPTSTVVLATGNTFTLTSPVTTTVYAEAVSSANSSLQTSFAGGNSCGGGVMFDITPTNGAVTIDSLEVNSTTAINNTFTAIIYYKIGSYIGSETNAIAWTAWDTIVVTSAGLGNPSKVVLNNPLFLNASQLHGMFINYTSSYTNGSLAYSNSDLLVQTGAGLCSAFGGVNPNRMFNGNIYYTKPGCTSPKVPVVFTVNPNPTLTINASATTICDGNSVTITASGVDSYTWSTSSMNASIIETPSVSTTYTVTGFSNACNSFDSQSISITVNETPTVSIVPSTTAICAMNGSISLNGMPLGGVYSGVAVTGSLLSIANAGTFTPMYSYTNLTTGCSNSATVTVIVANCTGIDNTLSNNTSVKVYPNPNSGSFVVETEDTGVKEIELIDLSGRVVFSENTENQNFKIDIQNLANGVYRLKVSSDKGTVIMKVIKQ